MAKKSIIKLRSYQKTMIEKMDEAFLNRSICFIKATTGSGKTFTIIHKAKDIANHGKKVIVSTFTNQLAKTISDKLGVPVVAGIENYFDTEKLYNLLGYIGYITKQDIDRYVKNLNPVNKNDYLIDSVFDVLGVNEEDKPIAAALIKNTKPQSYTTNIDDATDMNIIVTNHVYLLSSLMRTKKKSKFIKDYFLILDEVDKLIEASDLIHQHQYSVFVTRFATKQVINEIKASKPYRGSKTDLKKLKNNLINCEHLMNTIKSKKMSKKEAIKLISEKISDVNTERIMKNTYSSYCSILHQQQKELLTIKKLAWSKYTDIHLSPVRKYPSIQITDNKSPSSFLKYYLWGNIKKGCVGLSATINRDDDGLLGIKYTPFSFMSIKTKNIKQAKIYLASEDAPMPTLPFLLDSNADSADGYDDEKIKKSINPAWIDFVTDTVKKTRDGKNAMILVGGYVEVDLIAKFMQKKDISVNIICAKRGVTTNSTIKRFKNEGGILIGTRVFKDGIDLPDKELERLYIAKIPFYMPSKIFANKSRANTISWKSTKRAFEQALGRLRDKGNIYILDPRIYTHNRFTTLKNICKENGTLQKQTFTLTASKVSNISKNINF